LIIKIYARLKVVMAMVTRVASDDKCNGNGNKGGKQRQGWWASDSNVGDGGGYDCGGQRKLTFS
jgi:hypothetical protein